MEKFTALIINSITLLAKKLDALVLEVKKQKIEVNMKDVKMPEIKIPPIVLPKYPAFPEQKAPIVNVPAPVVHVQAPVVNVPAAQITVQPTPVEFPKEMKVEGIKELIGAINDIPEPAKLLEGVTNKNPIPVHIVDSKGKVMSANDFGGGLSGPSTVALRVGTTAVGEDNPMPVTVDGFAIPMFDTQVIDESGAPALTTITYKRSGVTVATKTITVAGTTTTVAVSIV